MLWRIRYWLGIWLNKLIPHSKCRQCYNGRINVVDLKNPRFKEAFERNYQEFLDARNKNIYLAAIRLEWLVSVHPFVMVPEIREFIEGYWVGDPQGREACIDDFVNFYLHLDSLPIASGEEREIIKRTLEELQELKRDG